MNQSDKVWNVGHVASICEAAELRDKVLTPVQAQENKLGPLCIKHHQAIS